MYMTVWMNELKNLGRGRGGGATQCTPGRYRGGGIRRESRAGRLEAGWEEAGT